jgi:hypothetical protein
MEDEHSSGYGSIPGAEFPVAVYRTIIVAFAWMLAAAWLAFGGTIGTDLDLTVASVLCLVFLALPIIMYRTSCKSLQKAPLAPKHFLSSRVEVATGPLSGGEAWLQVILIPFALALAATVIGGVYGWVG